MQSWITGIIVILTFVIKQPLAAQSGKELKAFKKEERRDVDSLFLVHSLPIFISHSDNFTQLTIEDSLMAVLKEKKYKLIDNSTYEQMFKSRFLEVMPNPASVTFKEDLKRLQTDKNY